MLVQTSCPHGIARAKEAESGDAQPHERRFAPTLDARNLADQCAINEELGVHLQPRQRAGDAVLRRLVAARE
jgi:hypothetical protein